MSINKNSMTSGKLTVDDLLSAMEQFDKAHKEPVQKVFVVGASHYEEAKKLFSNSDIKVVKSQTIDPKVVGYLMEKGAAEKCMDYERRILNEPTD